jgi:hypothetical protein
MRRAAEPPHFSIGSVIGGSLWITLWNFFAFVVMAFAVSIPVAAVLWIVAQVLGIREFKIQVSGWHLQGPPEQAAILGLYAVVALLAVLVVQAAVAHRTFQSMRGSYAGVGACLTRAVAILPGLIGAVIVLLVVFGILGGIASWLAIAIFTGTGSIALTGIAGAVVAAPLLFLLVACSVFLPVLVAERAGSLACFARSWTLTQGRRWAVLALLLLLAVVEYGILQLLLAAVEYGFLQLLLAGVEYGLALLFRLEFVLLAFSVPLSVATVMLTSSYYHLRGEQEGIEAVVRDLGFDEVRLLRRRS